MEQYIKELLFQHDCVIIPELGGFITSYQSAEVHPVRHTFVPATKKIAFNEKLKHNDGVLISSVANHERISIEDATRRVREFVYDIRQQIRENNRFMLPQIGTFSINQEYNLQFEPENKVNYNEGSFGLPELFFKPILREREGQRLVQPKSRKPVPAPERRVSRLPVWVYALVPLLLIGVVTAYFVVLRQDNGASLGNTNPFALFDERATAPAPQEEGMAALPQEPPQEETTVAASDEDFATETTPAVTDEAVATEFEAPAETESAPVTAAPKETTPAAAPVASAPAAEKATPTPTPSKYYHLIAGSFSRARNAQKLVAQFEGEGLTTEILNPDQKNNFKVSIAKYATVEEARTAREEMQARFKQDIWILKY
ncbi:Cell division protein FtsN [Catalinimonas alkaloidigena]|uniref:Cell division protein FtsN n=1 Tax=Catalinimonas alkaloidigena TaxID=1075417 RepID=A0A1G9S5E7_9BACT|nr:SPOR domain-containing protein [Catalinimonas alkaloidigena]SDM29975.1 Cell division protein FtsN [Catalinimonas alkaloidigena]